MSVAEKIKQIFGSAKDSLTYDEETEHYFKTLEKEVLKILAVHEEKLQELADMLKHRPHRTSIFFLTWFDEFEKKFGLLFDVKSTKDTKKEK